MENEQFDDVFESFDQFEIIEEGLEVIIGGKESSLGGSKVVCDNAGYDVDLD